MVKVMAPSEAHITACRTVWYLKPSKGMGSHTHLPNKLPQVGEHCTICKWTLVTLVTTSHSSSWRNIPRNHTTWNECTPSSIPPSKWACPLGSREPKEDDQEVTFPLWLQNNQLEEGFPLDHPSKHHVLHQQDQTWGN